MSNDRQTGHEQPVADAVLSDAYRRAAQELPPASLDTAILEMAHAEVDTPRVAPLGPTWFAPLALAASVVVAVSLGIQVMRDPESAISEKDFVPAVTEQDVVPAPPVESIGESQSAGAPPATPVVMPSLRHQQAPVNDADVPRVMSDMQLPAPLAKMPQPEKAAREPLRRRENDAGKPEQTVPRPLPAPESHAAEASSAVQRQQVAGATADRQHDAEAARASAAQRRYEREIDGLEGAVREAVAIALGEKRSADEWLRMIEALHREAHHEQSLIEFRAFRRVYPQAELPAGFPTIE